MADRSRDLPGVLGCSVPGHPQDYTHRCAEWDDLDAFVAEQSPEFHEALARIEAAHSDEIDRSNNEGRTPRPPDASP